MVMDGGVHMWDFMGLYMGDKVNDTSGDDASGAVTYIHTHTHTSQKYSVIHIVLSEMTHTHTFS